MRNVISLDDLKPTRAERLHWKDAIFDFVIIDTESRPVIALDFDGPTHKAPKSRAADLRKLSICSKARLPILKIDDDHLTAHEHVTILEFILQRFCAWRTEGPKYIRDYFESAESLARRGKAPDEIRDLLLGPDVEFHFAHYFPATQTIRTRLAQEYGLLPEYLTASAPKPFSEYHLASMLHNTVDDEYVDGFAKYRVEGSATKKSERKAIAWDIEAHTKMKWIFRKQLEPEEFMYYFEKTAMEVNEQMRKELGTYPAGYYTSFQNELPGLCMPDLAEMLSEYKCLCKIEQECIALRADGWQIDSATLPEGIDQI